MARPVDVAMPRLGMAWERSLILWICLITWIGSAGDGHEIRCIRLGALRSWLLSAERSQPPTDRFEFRRGSTGEFREIPDSTHVSAATLRKQRVDRSPPRAPRTHSRGLHIVRSARHKAAPVTARSAYRRHAENGPYARSPLLVRHLQHRRHRASIHARAPRPAANVARPMRSNTAAIANGRGGHIRADRDEAWFAPEIVPKLDGYSLSAIARATGLSVSACSRIRSGSQVPHVRYWNELLSLVTELRSTWR